MKGPDYWVLIKIARHVSLAEGVSSNSYKNQWETMFCCKSFRQSCYKLLCNCGSDGVVNLTSQAILFWCNSPFNGHLYSTAEPEWPSETSCPDFDFGALSPDTILFNIINKSKESACLKGPSCGVVCANFKHCPGSQLQWPQEMLQGNPVTWSKTVAVVWSNTLFSQVRKVIPRNVQWFLEVTQQRVVIAAQRSYHLLLHYSESPRSLY